MKSVKLDNTRYLGLHYGPSDCGTNKEGLDINVNVRLKEGAQ